MSIIFKSKINNRNKSSMLLYSLLSVLFISIFSCSNDAIIQEEEKSNTTNSAFKSAPCIASATPLYSNVVDVGDVGMYPTVADAVNAAKQQLNSTNVTLYFPQGTYALNAIHNIVGRTELYFDNLPNKLEILGDGPLCSIIKLETVQIESDNTGSVNCSPHPIWIKDCTKNVTIKNITIDGNADGLIRPDDCQGASGGFKQRNNIFIRGSESITIENIHSNNSLEDLVNIACSSNIIIKDSHFNNSQRNGITLGGGNYDPCGILNLRIRNNLFGSEIDTQQIDFEHGDFYTGVIIHENTFDTLNTGLDVTHQFAINLTGIRNKSFANTTLNANVFNNVLNQNAMLIRNSRNIDFENNKSVGQTLIDRGSSNIFLARNIFKIKPLASIPNLGYGPAGISIMQGGLSDSPNDNDSIPDIFTLPKINNISLQTNTIEVEDGINIGIKVQDALDVTLRNNSLENLASSSSDYGTFLKSSYYNISVMPTGYNTTVNIINPENTLGFNTIIAKEESISPSNGTSQSYLVTCNGNGCIGL